MLMKSDNKMVSKELDEDLSLELSPAWRAEVLKRCAEIDDGTAELLDADEVMARLHKMFEPN
jgi:hypothetical protein